MLVLSRKPGEEILIADDVRIRVIETVGGKVRIGIEAPHHVSIRRAELELRTVAAAQGGPVSSSPAIASAFAKPR